jgi:hypothetical protein
MDSFEGPNRAGAGLFFISGILELLPSGGLLECGAPTLAQHKSKQS